MNLPDNAIRARQRTTICVVGAGYVGLTTAACLARFGHRVHCIETDSKRLGAIQQGGLPIYEPGLEKLVVEARDGGLLTFGSDVANGMKLAATVMLCVGTPPRSNGEPDLRQLADAARSVTAEAVASELTIVVKSTVPPGSCEAIEMLAREAAPPGVQVDVVSNPEFLREGRAVEDFLQPDRVVIGAAREESAHRVEMLYPALWPIVHCDRRSAEMIKYASNTFLAAKISLANEVAGLCDAIGADASSVLRGVGLDARIGADFLNPGLGFGGSCLGKDLEGIVAIAATANCPMWMARSTADVNHRTRVKAAEQLARSLGRLAGLRIGALGLAFKPGTDDTRDSPAVAVIGELIRRGATIGAYDPLADVADLSVERHGTAYEAATDADALAILCAWPEFSALDPKRLRASMRGHVIFDGVGMVDGPSFESEGFEVIGVGRVTPVPHHPVVVRPLEWALDAALL